MKKKNTTKEEKEQEGKKVKTAKTKSPKGDKKALADKTFLTTVLIAGISLLVGLTAAAGFSFWRAQTDILANSAIEKQNAIETYTKAVNNNLLLLQKDVAQTARILGKNPLIDDFSNDAITALLASAKIGLPESMDIKLFVPGQYYLEPDAFPPVNYSTQKQLNAAEKDNISLPEFYTHKQGNYISIAHTVRANDSRNLAMMLLASYPAQPFLERLPEYNGKNKHIELLQTFERGSSQSIFSTGKKINGARAETHKTTHPNWQISITSEKTETHMSDILLNIAITSILILLPTLLAVFIGISLIKNNIEQDISLVLEFIRSGGKKSVSSELFNTALVKEFYNKLDSVNIEKKPAATKVKPEKMSAATFDIEISDGDENLFGAQADTMPNTRTNTKTTLAANAVNPSIFRAYDIRGVVGETLTSESVKLIGQSIGSEALGQNQNTVAVARDGRLSGPELMEALTAGILSSGCNVTDIGMVPTPLLYFACKTLNTKSGVMLTGSHNPSNHNGLKIVINGTTLSMQGIQKIRENIEQGKLKQGQGQRNEEAVTQNYLDAVENDIILAQAMNIVIDCGNGVAGVIAEELFTRIGCNVTPLYTEVDGNFPNHHPDPSQPKNLQALIDKVKETQAHIGIAFDGDGDRLGVVTNTGKIIWPDRLMMLFAKDILSRSPGTDIIFDVKCTNLLADVIRKHGGRPLMWKTGHSLIKAKMQEDGAQLAGEMSGHIFFNDRWYGFDDGLYSAARLLEILSTDSKTSDEVFAQFPERFATPEINIPIDDESKFDIVSVLASLGDFGEGSKTDIDGIRVDYPRGWGLIRASNTTANLVARFEADSEDNLAKIKALFKAQLLKIQADLDIPF